MEEENPTKPSIIQRIFSSVFNGISLSIFIGVLVFTISLFKLVQSVHLDPYANKMNVYFSDKTKFYESIDGHSNNLIIYNDSIYRNYIPKKSDLNDSTKAAPVFMIDAESEYLTSVFSQVHNELQYKFDTTKVASKDVFYFQKSKFIYDKIFYSSDKKVLSNYITSRDRATQLVIQKPKFQDVISSKKLFFNTYPKLLIWMVLISMVIAFSFSVIPFLLSETIAFYHSPWSLLKSILLSAAITIISVYPLMKLIEGEYDYLIKPLDTVPLFYAGLSDFGLHWNSLLPYAGVIFWLILIFVKFTKAERIAATIEIADPDELSAEELKKQTDQNAEKVKMIQSIEARFEGQFIALAIFLGFTIFCTDLFVSNLNYVIQADAANKVFPTEFSFMNGLMHTFFIGIIYLYMKGGFWKITSKLPKTEGATETSNNKTFVQYFKLIITMLAPVLGGAIQKLFELM